MNKTKKKSKKIIISILFSLLMTSIFFLDSEFGNIMLKNSLFISYPEFEKQILEHKISEITIKDDIIIFDIDNNRFYTTYPAYPNFKKDMALANIKVIKYISPFSYIKPLIPSLLLLFIAYIAINHFSRKMIDLQNNGVSNKLSKVSNVNTCHSIPDVTFDDIAGIEHIKEEILEILSSVENPKKYVKMGGKPVNGLLLEGPPGTGKTSLAKAIANHVGSNFLSISGSDFVEMFVGVGASRVRDVFRQAREIVKNQGFCIVFIDEIDAIGKKRGNQISGSMDEREQTLNQLLVELDGFGNSNDNILVIGATNRKELLDSALIRAGRFDDKVTVGLPDRIAREEIFKIHLKNKPYKDIDFKELSLYTEGLNFSGADIEEMVSKSIRHAIKRNSDFIEMVDLKKSWIQLIAGIPKKINPLSIEEKQLVSYHEAGHAIIANHLNQKILLGSVMPTDNSLGFIVRTPKTFVLDTKTSLKESLLISLAGRVAEELKFGKESITVGASSDFQKANDIAKDIVFVHGMSKLGCINIDTRKNYNQENFSEKLIEKGYDEVQDLLNNSMQEVTKILSENIEVLNRLAKKFIELETIEGDEIVQIIEESKNIKIYSEKERAI